MKHKTSYSITLYKTHDTPKECTIDPVIEVKTLDELYKTIAKYITQREYTFDVEVVFKRDGELPLYRQIWYYNHEDDSVEKYEVKKFKWFKEVLRVQRKLEYFMLNYGH